MFVFRFFVLAIAMSPLVVAAQTQWSVCGVVRGEASELLVGASVFADGTLQCATDTAGRFVFRTATAPKTVTVRYFGYFAGKKTLNPLDFDTLHAVTLDFQLVNQDPLLREVTITAKPLEAVIKEDFTSDIFDFGFAGRYLLLLGRERKRPFVRLIEDNGEPVAELQLPEECRLLHRSCTGDFHLVGERKTWELLLQDGKLDTLPAYPTAQFHHLVEPCAQQSAGRYYFIQRGVLNRRVRYLVFESGKETRVAFDLIDKKGMNMAREALRDLFMGKPIVFRTPYWAKQPGPTAEFEVHEPWGIFGTLSDVEGLTQLSGYDDDPIYRVAELETIRRDSVYAPIFKMGDTLCLFDHLNGRIVRFGPLLERTDIIPMYYHKEEGWQKILLQDAAGNRMYTCYSNRKGLILKEIDTHTGRSGHAYSLYSAPHFAEKFKIRNGLLYFIGQPDVNTPNKILYKMNIFAGLIR